MNENSLIKYDAAASAVTPYGGYPPPSTDRMDLSESIGFFRRQLKLILAVAATVVALGLAASFLMGTTYRAESEVMLTNEAAIVAQSNAVDAPQPALTGELLETQVEIIGSREMAQLVSNSLGLANGLDVAGQREVLDRLQENVSIERKGESWSAEEEAQFKQPILDQFEEQAHPLYASARLWDDGVIDPRKTRAVLILSLRAALNAP